MTFILFFLWIVVVVLSWFVALRYIPNMRDREEWHTIIGYVGALWALSLAMYLIAPLM